LSERVHVAGAKTLSLAEYVCANAVDARARADAADTTARERAFLRAGYVLFI
jgi:hypothetical protein